MSERANGLLSLPVLSSRGRSAAILLTTVALLCPFPGEAQDRPGADSADARAIENIRAFARLYGYVRFFHPSDEASGVDWDRVAVHGARRVVSASRSAELEAALNELFGPLAPTVQLYPADEAPPAPDPMLLPSDTSGAVLVAWQHRGVGLGNPGPYQSVRLNRETEIARRSTFGSVAQRVDASPYRGMEVRYRAALKTDVLGSGNQGQLWLRVDRPNRQTGYFDNMSDRPVTSREWEVVEITGRIDPDAESIVFGAFLHGSGRMWVDGVELSVRAVGDGAWNPVPLSNPSFEEGSLGDAPTGWSSGGPGYRYVVTDEAYLGSRSLLIENASRTQMATALFPEHAAPGETIRRPLGQGLAAQIPLALYSREGRTLPPAGAPRLAALHSALQPIPTEDLTAADAGVRFGAVVIGWNILQHFYPYFDVVDVDWDAVLTETLRRASGDRSAEEFLSTLRWMVAQLEDGHGGVAHPSEGGRLNLPFLFDRVEGRIVITAVDASNPPACGQRGDVLVDLDGTPIEQVLATLQRYISGSPQWRQRRALWQLGWGPANTPARLTVRRSESTIVCDVTRTLDRMIAEDRPEPIEQLKDGVFYVDLSRVEMDAFNRQAIELAGADGIVFDLRGYPNGTHAVLQHLTDVPIQSAHWQVPRQIYPDQADLVGYDTSGRWDLPPASPRFSGRIAFLTDERAISYAESVMGIVEHYALGEIIGRPTAGANGNVNSFALPGGYTVGWTGMRVIKHDGSQHHLIGIRPTLPVERTLSAVRAGRDEDLEAALAWIETKVTTRPDQ